MATKSRYEAYAKSIVAKRDEKIARAVCPRASVLATLKDKKAQTNKPVTA